MALLYAGALLVFVRVGICQSLPLSTCNRITNKKGASIAHALLIQNEIPTYCTPGFGRIALPLGVLRPLARLVTPVLLALDLARIARQHPALAQRRPQRLGRSDQRARNSVTHRVGLRRDSAALDAHQHVVLPDGFGRLERLEDPHARGRAREVILERALVNRDRAAAGQHSDARDRGLATASSPDDIFLFCHGKIVPYYTLTLLGFCAACGCSAPR